MTKLLGLCPGVETCYTCRARHSPDSRSMREVSQYPGSLLPAILPVTITGFRPGASSDTAHSRAFLQDCATFTLQVTCQHYSPPAGQLLPQLLAKASSCEKSDRCTTVDTTCCMAGKQADVGLHVIQIVSERRLAT